MKTVSIRRISFLAAFVGELSVAALSWQALSAANASAVVGSR